LFSVKLIKAMMASATSMPERLHAAGDAAGISGFLIWLWGGLILGNIEILKLLAGIRRRIY
jgi:hypothetical protein